MNYGMICLVYFTSYIFKGPLERKEAVWLPSTIKCQSVCWERNGRGEYTVLLESIDGSDPNSCTLFTVCGEFTICATGLFALLLESM